VRFLKLVGVKGAWQTFFLGPSGIDENNTFQLIVYLVKKLWASQVFAVQIVGVTGLGGL